MTTESNPAPPPKQAMVRNLLGGLLMGLANLVPGISGGTMLLAAGVYPAFVEGIAELTTFKFRMRTLLTLASIGGAAAAAIALFAGPVRTLVVDHRWAMFSLFIGLTLGGVPVVWRLLKPANVAAWIGCAAGIAVMAAMAMLEPGASDTGAGPQYGMLFFAGTAGAAAMILPGVSGGYLLLVLGQYIPILSAIDDLKQALLAAGGPDVALLTEALKVVIPVGIGVVLGVVGVSNLIRWLLHRFEKATLGVLLGLLFGAVLGLWPFQQGVRPEVGAVIKGRVMTEELIAEVEPKDYPMEHFSPTGAQVGMALGLIVVGFGIAQGVAHIGRSKA
ncbi:MAG: DUF368 domain-containing protein [Bryobacterales bacterium]